MKVGLRTLKTGKIFWSGCLDNRQHDIEKTVFTADISGVYGLSSTKSGIMVGLRTLRTGKIFWSGCLDNHQHDSEKLC